MLEDGGDEVRVQVQAAGAGNLVIAYAMQQGWVASVDGRAAILRCADEALVAVFVPAGRHELRLRYDPSGWRIGQLVSIVSVVLLLLVGGGGVVAVAAWRGRPSRPRVR